MEFIVYLHTFVRKHNEMIMNNHVLLYLILWTSHSFIAHGDIQIYVLVIMNSKEVRYFPAITTFTTAVMNSKELHIHYCCNELQGITHTLPL